MASLLSLATVEADHRVTASDTKAELGYILSPGAARHYQHLIDHYGNRTRHLVLPFRELRRLGSIDERNRQYAIHAVRLGEMAARRALDRSGVTPGGIDAVVAISSTGLLMPTLETHLIERLGLPANCRRVPLTHLGCAGGAAGLSLAKTLSTVHSGAVLVVSVELPSLSIPVADVAPSDVLASTQFGDGAAAAVVASCGNGDSPVLLSSGSFLFPDTISRESVQVTPAGLRLVRSRGLTDLLRDHLGDAVNEYLGRNNLSRDDVAFWVIHPRNPELLEAAAGGLQLSDDAIAASRTVWCRSGNIISAAVFHVLEELSTSTPPRPGSLGMMIAFGAGVACEMVLLRAAGWLCRGGLETSESGCSVWVRS